MNRVKVELPDSFSFSTEMAVRITDLNYGGHVGNDTFLSLLQEARMQYLHQYGYSELQFEGVSLIMADAAIEYKHELAYGANIRVSVTATGFDKLGFDIYYLVELLTPDGTKTAAKAKTGMICFDYTEKKKAAVPEYAKSKLQQHFIP